MKAPAVDDQALIDACASPAALARVNALDDWRFIEWFHVQTLEPMGIAGQSWNAATFLLVLRSLQGDAAAC